MLLTHAYAVWLIRAVRGAVVRIGFVAVRQFYSRKTATPHSLGRYRQPEKRVGSTAFIRSTAFS